MNTKNEYLFDSGSGYNAKPRKIGAFAILSTAANQQEAAAEAANFYTDFEIMAVKHADGFPYKEARVVIPPNDAVDPRIYIVCYAWDAFKNKMVRKRYYRHASVKDKKRQLALIKADCKKINELLASGAHLNKKGVSVNPNNTYSYKGNTNLVDGIKLALDNKASLRTKTYRNYKLYGNDFIKWLKATGFDNIKPADFNKLLADRFKKFLTDNNYSPRTINNYLAHNQTLFEYLIQIELATDNPFKKVDRLTVGLGRNVAFTKEQQVELMQFMDKNCPHIKRLCQFMYYTMARPNEIAHMRVKWVGYKAPDKIYLPEDISKSCIERNITIPAPLQGILDDMDLHKCNPDWYLFSTGLKPGPVHVPANKIADKFTTHVLKKIVDNNGKRKLGSDYTLYSWKHTSVVNNYRGGMSRAALKQQLGYRYDYSLEAYLKSLALIDEPDLKNKFVAI